MELFEAVAEVGKATAVWRSDGIEAGSVVFDGDQKAVVSEAYNESDFGG
jgi:hypothetical protein